MMNVACCLWGDWAPEYVVRLRRAVKRNLDIEHRFICFADREMTLPDIEVRPLDPPLAFRWRGCLPKLAVYRPEAGLKGKTLLFDLDNVIVGSLAGMAGYPGEFCVRARLPDYDRGERWPDGDMILFTEAAARKAWAAIEANPQKITDETGGRERYFLTGVFPDADLWQDICPGQVVSYKHHCRKRLPEGARVVSFHGRPRPHERLDVDWIREAWQ